MSFLPSTARVKSRLPGLLKTNIKLVPTWSGIGPHAIQTPVGGIESSTCDAAIMFDQNRMDNNPYGRINHGCCSVNPLDMTVIMSYVITCASRPSGAKFKIILIIRTLGQSVSQPAALGGQPSLPFSPNCSCNARAFCPT